MAISCCEVFLRRWLALIVEGNLVLATVWRKYFHIRHELRCWVLTFIFSNSYSFLRALLFLAAAHIRFALWRIHHQVLLLNHYLSALAMLHVFHWLSLLIFPIGFNLRLWSLSLVEKVARHLCQVFYLVVVVQILYIIVVAVKQAGRSVRVLDHPAVPNTIVRIGLRAVSIWVSRSLASGAELSIFFQTRVSAASVLLAPSTVLACFNSSIFILWQLVVFQTQLASLRRSSLVGWHE